MSTQTISYKLSSFEGPLDLLLHLIDKNKIDIFDIPIALILSQYMEYMRSFEAQSLDISAEFIEMAARLVCIKSRMLLPKSEDEGDPRAELVGELVEYGRVKALAKYLADKFELYSGRYTRDPGLPDMPAPDYDEISEDGAMLLYRALQDIIGKRGKRERMPSMEPILKLTNRRIVTVSGKIIAVLRKLYTAEKALSFADLIYAPDNPDGEPDISEIVTVFIALLELLRAKRISVSADDLNGAKIELRKEK